MSVELVVGHTWDGKQLPPSEQARVRVALQGDELRIEVDAPLHDDPPPPHPPGATPELWNHEVVELFVLGPDDRYLEVELGPHGHHLVLQLRGVRRPVADRLPIRFEATRSGSRWTGRAQVPASLLPPRPWRTNAYRIHGQGEGRRYLVHQPLGGDAPDFHRLDGFVPLPL